MADLAVKRHAGWTLPGLPAYLGPLVILAIMAMIIVPLPPVVISFLFALNIAAGLVILATSLYVRAPTDLTVLPSVLLITTLARLSLNVATARIILLHGFEGADAAGKVVESFGRFVVGGNYVVGFILFVILIVINFVVVTKGAGRVAEVAARFVLDSMPGKQMAIDADVNAGVLNPKLARDRRQEIRREADFFGAMDGASKFIRGDVVAAVIILAINLIGGLVVGVLQHHLPLAVAARSYTLLTVGDGLAAQIPSLTISIAAGLVVTRVATGEDVGRQLASQIGRYPQALAAGAALLFVLGVIPGMAHWPFLLFALLCAAGAWRGYKARDAARVAEAGRGEVKAAQPEAPANPLAGVDALGLEIGFALVPLVKPDAALLPRLRAVRERFGTRMGFNVPRVTVRDSGKLGPNEYRFTVRGASIGHGSAWCDRWLAIAGPSSSGEFTRGRATRDPAYGSAARWIESGDIEAAEAAGYTVADSSAVLATHFDRLLQLYGYELLGRPQVQELLGALSRRAPKLGEELGRVVTAGALRRVLQDFVREGLPVRDMESLAEALTEAATAGTKDAVGLYAAARRALGRFIVETVSRGADVFTVAVLQPELEKLIEKGVITARERGVEDAVEPRAAAALQEGIAQAVELAHTQGWSPVLAVRASIRYAVSRTVSRDVATVALEEIPRDARVRVAAAVPQAAATGGPDAVSGHR